MLQVIHFCISSPASQTQVASGVSPVQTYGISLFSQPAHLTGFDLRSGMTSEISIHTLGDEVRLLTKGAASHDFATANPC